MHALHGNTTTSTAAAAAALTKGSRVAVWWPEDDPLDGRWYTGKIRQSDLAECTRPRRGEEGVRRRTGRPRIRSRHARLDLGTSGWQPRPWQRGPELGVINGGKVLPSKVLN